MGEEVEEILSAAEREALRMFGHEMEPDGDETKLARRVLECPNTGNDGWYSASAITLAAAYLSLRASLTRVEEERGEAVKALEPFAQANTYGGAAYPDGVYSISFSAGDRRVSSSDFHTARDVHKRLSRANE